MHKLSHLLPAPRRLAVLAVGALLAASWSYGQTAAFQALPDEAPESLFDVKLGSAEAELLVNGTWKASASLQGGLLLDASGGVSLAEEQPFLFSQVPDLYVSFLLYRKLFAEIRVSNTASETKYSIGYRGGEGELLRELHIGNDGVSFPSLPFLSLGSGSYRSFGLAARLEEGAFDGRAMLRYDQAKRVVKRFIGGSEVTETVIQAPTFVRGRWLVAPLPASKAVMNLALYAASAGGALSGSDGKAYRRMEASEFSYSATTGFISLAKKAETRIVAYYSDCAGALSLDGKTTCLPLYDPDATGSDLGADTLALNRYVIASSAGTDAFVRDRATGLRDDGYSVRVDSSGYLEVSYGDITDPHDASGYFCRPFASVMPDIYTTDYSEESKLPYLPALSKEIVVLLYSSSPKIAIDTDVVEGSVEVSRNGIPDYAFTVDASAGKLELATAPGLDEQIEVSYLRQSAERSAGSLAAGLGGFFDLGEGLSAWTALGLRWSVPGTSYAESGVPDPGSVVFTAGEKDSEGAFTQSFALAGRWSTEVASGRYRIEGMESAGSQSSSFWPVPTGSGFSVVEEEDGLLASSFPTIAANLHASGTAQKALHITSSTGMELALVKYIDEPPVAALRTFSFFARGTAGGASLAIAIDKGMDGVAADDELRISIPGSALSTGWRRFVLRYGYGSTEICYQDNETDDLHAIASGASGAVNLDFVEASRLSITLAGATSETDLWIDEIVLEESIGSAALLAKGELHYADENWSLGLGRLRLLHGIEVGADVSGAWCEDSFATGGSSIATSLGPFDLSASLRASVARDEAHARGGHAISFAPDGLPLSARDVFDMDPATGSFGRSDSLSLGLGPLLALEAGQTTIWAGQEASGTGLFSQDWKASLNAFSGILTASLDASNRAYPEGFGGLTGDYFSGWLEGYTFAVPSFEADSTKRAFQLTAQVGLGSGTTLVKASFSATGLPAASGAPREDEALFRVQAPLSFGEALLLTPYYQRTWKARIAGSGGGLVDLWATACTDLAAALPLWSAIPFAELFGEGAFGAFASSASGDGFLASSYTPELGLALVRESGSSWLDLLLPASLVIAWKSQSSRADDTLTLAHALSFAVKFEAVNVFGAFGAFPIARTFDSDEYSTACQVQLGETTGEDFLWPSFIIQNLATFYARDNRDSLTVDSRFSYASDASSTKWSEDLKLSLSVVTARSWLLDLYEIILGLADGKGDAEGERTTGGKLSIASSYFETLARTPPVARFLVSVSGTMTSTTTDADGTELAFDANESVEFKLTVPQKLTLSFKPAANQTRDADTGSTVLGLSLTLSATVSF